MNTDTNILTGDRVYTIFCECLFLENEDTSVSILAKGLTFTAGFNPERLEKRRQDIHDMLAELPDVFKTGGGGGGSFLHACMDKHGNLWTGEHRTQEYLVMLGIAIGEVEFCLPREVWSVLPGGMPYFEVKQ